MTDHAGTYGECCAGPRPTTPAERTDHERGWRFHWGAVDAATGAGPCPDHFAPDYRAGWHSVRPA